MSAKDDLAQRGLSTGRMGMASYLTWERADDVVDQRISRENLHVWPFRASYPVDVRFLILDRRYEIPAHRPDHLEIVVFESGKLDYEVEGHCCVVGKNDVIVVGDRLRHRCLPRTASQAKARNVVLSFLPEAVHQNAPVGDDFQYLMPFSVYGPAMPNVIPSSAGLSREILDIIWRIQQEIPGDTELSRLAIRTYLKMILLLVFGHCSEFGDARAAFSKKNEARERLAPIFEHLRHHYDEPIRVADAARICALSSCCFMSLFKEVTGHSFVAYLNGFRVTMAQGLLATTNKPLAEISLEAGFCTQSYFGMVFRRLTGTTPLAYRLECGGGESGTVKPQ